MATLEPFGEELWLARTPLRFLGLPIGRVMTVWPNQARTEHQIAEPTIVIRLNIPKFIRTIPAGMEIKCRMTGSKRAKKMPPAA